jgi:phage RecT family recombinase
MDQQLTTPIAQEAENSVMALMKRYGNEFASVIPPQYTAKYFGGLVKVAIIQTPKLAGCTAVSFVNSVLTAASLGLPIRKNSAYLLPYGKECQLVIDYHGKLDLARRAGVGSVHVELVRQGDEYRYGFDRGGLDFLWTPARERGEITDLFVAAKVNNDVQYTVMTLNDVEVIRSKAQAGRARDFDHYGKRVKGLTLAEIRALDIAALPWNSPYKVPWVEWYDRQARKTAIHRAAHDWPLSPQLMISQELDVANETGQAAPIDEKLAMVIDRIDPADNRPMVDGGGDSYAEQKEAAAVVGAEQLAKAEARRSGPPVTKGQCDKIHAAAATGKLTREALQGILSKHWATSVPDLKQSDYDSVMAAIEEAAQ